VTALLLFEVIDTAAVMADAILAWIVVAAFVATVVVYTLVLTGAWAWRAVRRGSAAPLPAEQAPQAPESTPTPQRRTAPAWARTDKEAA
jgi:hypothetical protein